MQTWPLLRNLPMTAAWATCFTSASGKTINGAWPPSSRLSRLTWSAERRISSLPTSVEPVKLILRTAGCSKKASANWIGVADDEVGDARRAGRRRPGTRTSAIRDSGVWSAGRLTIVQPAARAGAIFRLGRAIGKFQGVIVPTTPTGCLIAWCRLATFVGGMIRP